MKGISVNEATNMSVDFLEQQGLNNGQANYCAYMGVDNNRYQDFLNFAESIPMQIFHLTFGVVLLCQVSMRLYHLGPHRTVTHAVVVTGFDGTNGYYHYDPQNSQTGILYIASDGNYSAHSNDP